MIEDNAFGLEGFELVESSEQGMLAQVARATKSEEPIVFLGWEPHPMNANFDLAYLSGGDDVFGPNYGGATVYTNVRAGYLEECPNVGQLLKNLKFTLAMENEIMGAILDDGEAPEDAAAGLAQGAPRGARCLARRRHHARRRARPARGQGAPRHLVDGRARGMNAHPRRLRRDGRRLRPAAFVIAAQCRRACESCRRPSLVADCEPQRMRMLRSSRGCPALTESAGRRPEQRRAPESGGDGRGGGDGLADRVQDPARQGRRGLVDFLTDHADWLFDFVSD